MDTTTNESRRDYVTMTIADQSRIPVSRYRFLGPQRFYAYSLSAPELPAR